MSESMARIRQKVLFFRTILMYIGAIMRYLGCRKGVARGSHGCRKFEVTAVCSWFAPNFATLAIPLRYPCDGGGVEATIHIYQRL